MRSLSLRPDDPPSQRWLCRSAHSLHFLRDCDPCYRVLTLALVGLPPTEYASLKLDTDNPTLQADAEDQVRIALLVNVDSGTI
jgi:hypothetical protein